MQADTVPKLVGEFPVGPVAAWRGLDDFGGRSSLRTWLYRIATNRCLNALRDSSRRPQPEAIRTVEPTWPEPYPDLLVDDLADAAPERDARYETKYLRDPQAPIARAHGIVVLTLAGDRISHITRFGDTSLFALFGLPRTLDA